MGLYGPFRVNRSPSGIKYVINGKPHTSPPLSVIRMREHLYGRNKMNITGVKFETFENFEIQIEPTE